MRPGLSPWMVLLSSLQRGWVSSRGRLSKGPSGSMVSQRRLPVAMCVQRCACCMRDFDRARAPGGVPLNTQLQVAGVLTPLRVQPTPGSSPHTSPCLFPSNPLLLSEIGHLSATRVTLSTGEEGRGKLMAPQPGWHFNSPSFIYSALMSQTGDPGTSKRDMAPAAGETENTEASKQSHYGL